MVNRLCAMSSELMADSWQLIFNFQFSVSRLPKALGIGAASFWSAAEKDIAESPTAEPERPIN